MSTARIKQEHRRKVMFFATVSIICGSYSALAVLLMHLLRPDYSPVSSFLSNYAVGQFGWVMTTAFLALSGACLALVLAVVRSGLTSLLARIGTVLLGIASVGLLTSSIFPTDLPGGPRTQTGEIHSMSFLVNIGCILMAALFFSFSFGRHPNWRPYQRTSFILTALIVLGFVLQFLTLHRGAPYGIANRFFFVTLLAWLLALSIRLRASARANGN